MPNSGCCAEQVHAYGEPEPQVRIRERAAGEPTRGGCGGQAPALHTVLRAETVRCRAIGECCRDIK